MKTHWFPLIRPAIKPLFLGGKRGIGGVPLGSHDDFQGTFHGSRKAPLTEASGTCRDWPHGRGVSWFEDGHGWNLTQKGIIPVDG